MKKTQAEKMAKENGLSIEINQAYINNVGGEYSTAEDVEEAYQGQYNSDLDFAYEMAEGIGFEVCTSWPGNCIDWEQAAHELMYDYFEEDGYYFRNL